MALSSDVARRVAIKKVPRRDKKKCRVAVDAYRISIGKAFALSSDVACCVAIKGSAAFAIKGSAASR